jgi:uncharacterized membrane protein
VVALQLSSTQFSPRLLRNFLRDRGTQVALSTFIATFVYSAAGLFTVGLEAGTRTEVYPRLAVSGAIALLFLSLAMVVYFADHLAHSIQIDAINRRVGRNTRRAIAHDDTSNVSEVAPDVPEWAVPLLARRSAGSSPVREAEDASWYQEIPLPITSSSSAVSSDVTAQAISL